MALFDISLKTVIEGIASKEHREWLNAQSRKKIAGNYEGQ